jgi:hypothetical protein
MAKKIRVSVYINEDAEPELFKMLNETHSMRRPERLRYYATTGLEFETWRKGQPLAQGQIAEYGTAPLPRPSKPFAAKINPSGFTADDRGQVSIHDSEG